MGPGPHTVLACLAEPGRRGKQVVCPCFTPLPFSVELDAYGASLTCHVPRTYHAGSGVVRADKAGEAFTRQVQEPFATGDDGALHSNMYKLAARSSSSCLRPGNLLTYLPTYLPPARRPYLPTFDVVAYRAT